MFGGNAGEKLFILVERLLKKYVASHSLQEHEALIVYISVLEQQAKYGVTLNILSGKLGSLFVIETDRLCIKGRLLAWASDSSDAANIFQKILELSLDDWECVLHYLGCLLEGKRDLYHSWIVDDITPDKLLDSTVLSRQKKFSAMSKLKKMALHVCKVALPLNWWVLMIMQGITLLLVSSTMSFWGYKFPRLLCILIAATVQYCLFMAGIVCSLSLSAILNEEVSIKVYRINGMRIQHVQQFFTLIIERDGSESNDKLTTDLSKLVTGMARPSVNILWFMRRRKLLQACRVLGEIF